MDSTRSFSQTKRALGILSELGISIEIPAFLDQMAVFQRLCSTWNPSAKLMSKGDLEGYFDDHIADSLSLAAEIHRLPELRLVDIGSGGGFPAIPLALTLPGRYCLLIERSQTKADYLRQAIRSLALDKTRVINAQFPCPLDAPAKRIYTARAVERPEAFDSALLARLEPGDVYLMQRAPTEDASSPGLQLCEILDTFTEAGLRRGALYRVRREVPRETQIR